MKQTVKWTDIKTPQTVEEFRQNLAKYFFCVGNKEGALKEKLYVSPVNSYADFISIDEISSTSDIYKLTQSGFGGDGTSPSITPLIEFEWDGKGGVTEFMKLTNQYFRANGYWSHPESEFTIWDGTQLTHEEMTSLPQLKWYTLDNQLIREFYMKTLGEFSGYVPNPEWFENTKTKVSKVA